MAASSDYDHDLGFRPDRDGFSFANYGEDLSGGGLTAAELRELLGDDSVCATATDAEGCAVRADVVAWAQANQEVARAGHCEGMSAASLAMFVGLEDPTDFGGDTTFGIPFDGNEGIARRIDGWHATQFTEPTRSAATMTAPNDLVVTLAASFDTLDDVYTLGLFNRVEGRFANGHTVVPYGIDERGPTSTRVYVYDSNLPGEERFVEIDPTTDSWSYQGASTTYDGSVDLQLLSLSARLETPRVAAPIDLGRGQIPHATCVPE